MKRGRSRQAFAVPERDVAHASVPADARKMQTWLTVRCSHRLARVLAAGSALASLAGPAWAAGPYLATSEIVTGSLMLGVMSATMVSAIWMIRQRGRMEAERRELKAHLSDARHNISRLQALIGDKDRRIVVWDGLSQKPEFLGQLPPETGAPREDRDFLAFGRWLKASSAGEIERAVERLRSQAQSFDLIVETSRNQVLEAQGRVSGGQAFVLRRAQQPSRRSRRTETRAGPPCAGTDHATGSARPYRPAGLATVSGWLACLGERSL
jgi:hypothetical protein